MPLNNNETTVTVNEWLQKEMRKFRFTQNPEILFTTNPFQTDNAKHFSNPELS